MCFLIPSVSPPSTLKVSLADAFGAFGIRINEYHSYINNFCVVSEIPETEQSLVAAAWLTEFFDLVAENQPDVMACHYDPITLWEIYTLYQVCGLV